MLVSTFLGNPLKITVTKCGIIPFALVDRSKTYQKKDASALVKRTVDKQLQEKRIFNTPGLPCKVA